MTRILVVDDDPDLLALVARRLKNAGHRVQAAASPADALELVRVKGTPDAVVLDVTMPMLNGFELLTAIRECTQTPDLPAVFLSGRIQPEEIAEGRALGAVYLTKPYVASALLHAIDTLLAAQLVAVDDW